MRDRSQLLELSLTDVLSEKIKQKASFTISAKSRFGSSTNEVFHFDLQRNTLFLDYSIKNSSHQTLWFHETREFIRFSMITDINNNVRFNVMLVPEHPKKEQSDTAIIGFDFFSTGIVEKVI